MPDFDGLPTLFDDATDARVRIRRLVSEVYAMYERGAPEIEPMLREPDMHPALRQAAGHFETLLNALVDAALEPLDAGEADRRVARALVALPTWRALRDQV